VKYLLILFGLIAACLYLWGMRRNRPTVALLGIVCIDLQFGIITAMLIYAHSYMLASAFGFSTLYVLSGLVRPSKKDT
jgi:ABC-type Na+ efflux pump permease subunit